jgi:S1-C subfamily serine protease
MLGLSAEAIEARDFSAVFARVNPAVVVINTAERFSAPDGSSPPISVAGIGSGVMISNEGEVLTAAHVVETADEVYVRFLSGETIFAEVIASEPQADIALLQLERMPDKPVVAPLADSDEARVGDEVFIIGAPYGLSHTLTVGHISARHQRAMGNMNLAMAEFFQTDAAINEGNSGGPMFSVEGEVLGIVSHIISQSGGFEGLGFVVTSNAARRLVMDEPSIWSGISGFRLEGEMAALFHLPQEAGVLVQRVARWSPAEALGLRGGNVRARIAEEPVVLGGDVILAVQDITLDSEASYARVNRAIAGLSRGDELRLTILRAGRVVQLQGPWLE